MEYKLTQTELQQFTGSTNRYRHSLNRTVVYSDGVQYLAENAGAYWLIDAIASYLTPSYLTPSYLTKPAAIDSRIKEMHFWKLHTFKDSQQFWRHGLILPASHL